MIVAATGTGKTWVAAFDYKRLRDQGLAERVLFVAHREEILRQSQNVFQLVIGQPDFGDRLGGGKAPEDDKHLFASIQSLARGIGDLDPNSWDMVVIDEFHHAAASTYDELLKHVKPRYLLGLTATPERADGKSILRWFDDRGPLSH